MPGHKFALAALGSVLGVWLIAMIIVMRASALPAQASGTMLVVFNPGTPQDKIFASLVNAGAKPIRETSFGFIWVVTGEEPGLSGRLRSQGAIGNYRNLPLSPTIAGCFAYADAKVAEALE
jgi:hypothetical protein